MPSAELILYVENDPDDAFLAARAFKKAGVTHGLRNVENGMEAIAYLQGTGAFAERDKNPLPSIILLDWNMPLMNGREFLVWLREQTLFKRIPVIVLTSSDAESDMLDAYDEGANGFLVKPKSLDDFIKMCSAFDQFWLGWNRSEFRSHSTP